MEKIKYGVDLSKFSKKQIQAWLNENQKSANTGEGEAYTLWQAVCVYRDGLDWKKETGQELKSMESSRQRVLAGYQKQK